MKYLIALLMMFQCAVAFAIDESDSLLQELKYAPVEKRITLLNSLSRNYTIRAKQDSAMICANLAFRESEKAGSETGITESYISLCFCTSYYDREKFNNYVKQLLEHSKKTGNNKGLAYACLYLSTLDDGKSTVDDVNYLTRAQQLFEKEGNSLDAAIALTSTAELFSNNSDYATALKYAVKALNLYDKSLHLSPDVYNTYNYSLLCNLLGIIYKNLNEYDKSINYYGKYLELSRRIGEWWGVAIAYNNLGTLERNRLHYDKALEYYEKSLKIWNILNVDSYLGDLYLNMGNAHLEKYNFGLAEACFDSSMKYFSGKDSPLGASRVETCRGNLYMYKKDFRTARSKYLQALELNKTEGNLEITVENYRGLSSACDSLGDYRNAYYYYKLFTEKKDSLYNMEKATEVGRVTANYETQRQIEERRRLEEQAAAREKEVVNRRNTLEYSGMTIFVLVLFTFMFLSGKLRISDTFLEVMVFVSLLLLFEFIQVLLDPFINRLTGSEPFYLLLVNLVIVAAIIPIDAYLERFLNKRVLKNQAQEKKP